MRRTLTWEPDADVGTVADARLAATARDVNRCYGVLRVLRGVAGQFDERDRGKISEVYSDICYTLRKTNPNKTHVL